MSENKQKDEVITIRVNSTVKKAVEAAKNFSGHTSGDWLAEALLAWEQIHDMEKIKEQDSAHIIAGRKALGDLGNILEALESVSKQVVNSTQENIDELQERILNLEEDIEEKNAQTKKVIIEYKNKEKEYIESLKKIEQENSSLKEQLAATDANNKTLKNIGKWAEDERANSQVLKLELAELQKNIVNIPLLQEKINNQEIMIKELEKKLQEQSQTLMNVLAEKSQLAGELIGLEKAWQFKK